MTRRKAMLVSGLLLVLLPGCLEFERQTVTCRHDAATDTLYIFQDYQEIFGADDPVALSNTEWDQMASVMKGGRTFFFGNWITEYNRQTLEELQQRPKGDLNPNEAYETDIRTLAELALANVQVENLGFYLNRENRLCGAQQVTVRNISKVLAALNKALLVLARSEAEKDNKSEEEKRLLLQFANSGQKALRLEGHRLELRWPITEADYLKFKDRTPQGAAFREAGAQIAYSNGIIITLGEPGAKSLSLTMPVSQFPYHGNALLAAWTYGIKESYDAANAAKAFLENPGAGKEDPTSPQ